jgi:GWxTD domain-containing protein
MTMSRSSRVTLVLFLFLTGACQVSTIQKELAPQYAEFLSQTRYIITEQERKDFLALPDSAKPQFIEEFWKRRDPDPYSEVNEFKLEYLQRIDEANRLFVGEGKPGWLTERGRIYILYGPPGQRSTAPLEASGGKQCQEVWHYEDFAVTFVDRKCNGRFLLETHDLSRLRGLNIAQAARSRMAAENRPHLEFELAIKKNTQVTSEAEGLVDIDIPVNSIWFSAEEEKFETTLDLELEIRDSQNVLRWEYKKSYEVTMTLDQLKEAQNKKYRIVVPFSVDEDVATFRQGKNTLQVALKNSTGKEEVRKTAEFKF